MSAATVSAPPRSLVQRRDALQRANDIRSFRCQMKRDAKCGKVDVAAVLADPPDRMVSMPVFKWLLAKPKYGRARVHRVLTHCRISPSKTIGGLSERQRTELVSYMGFGR